MKKSDPFKSLGLTDKATPQQVEDAWRNLRSRIHPDRGGDTDAFISMKLDYERAKVIASEEKVCDTCRGSGMSDVRNGWSVINVMCPTCRGSGKQ